MSTTTPVEWGGKPLGDIRVRAQETADAVELSVAHTLPEGADVLLHWGLVSEGRVSAWTAPDPALWPSAPDGAKAPTVPAGGAAVESTFPAAGDGGIEHELRLRFPKPAPAAAAALAAHAAADAPAAAPTAAAAAPLAASPSASPATAPGAAVSPPPPLPESPPPPPLPDEVRFVVLRRDPAKGNMWLKQK